jgi:hypothetical protein
MAGCTSNAVASCSALFFPISNLSFSSILMFFALIEQNLDSVHPEIGKFGRDQGFRKIFPEAYG